MASVAIVFCATFGFLIFGGSCDAIDKLPDSSNKINLLKSVVVREGDVKDALESELSFAKGALPGKRLREIKEVLKPMYAALPKNDDGTLDHQTVRYALHRFFNNRSGWFIRGLEPGGKSQSPGDGAPTEWIPSFLQDLLEQHIGRRHGATLEQVAAMAAALQDIVKFEAVERLKTIYKMHELNPDESLANDDGAEVLETYYISFLLAGNLTVKSLRELEAKKSLFMMRYAGWVQADDWLREMVKVNFPYLNEKPRLTFKDIATAATAIGEKFYDFNDIECNDLKQTLRDLESSKPGRVPLATFYNQGLYSHWKFVEQVDYLRTLGALDESDSHRKYVIIANYAMARPNCLDASKLYGICCRNDCETMMGHLESTLGSATAPAWRIADVVSQLPSAFVKAPREIPAHLLARLDQIAERNGGEVPLHGRLFAQWMHHQYPLECPFPHEKGTTSPLTADEWMRETGQKQESASTEEMLRHVEKDTCAVNTKGKIECAGENSEIPWSDVEELLVSPRGTLPMRQEPTALPAAGGADPHVGSGAAVGLLAVLALVALVLGRFFRPVRECRGLIPHAKDDDREFSRVADALVRAPWRSALALICFASLAWSLDLVDGTVVCCGTCMGLVVLLIPILWVKYRGSDHVTPKCDV